VDSYRSYKSKLDIVIRKDLPKLRRNFVELEVGTFSMRHLHWGYQRQCV
jgi:hypothetical protein